MRNPLLAALVLGLSTSAMAQSPGAEDTDATAVLDLACDGGGVIGGKTEYSARMYVRIDGNDGAAQLPQRMVPAFNRGGDGWFAMHDVVVGPDRITAKLRFNPLSSLRLEIDRVHGEIRVAGAASTYAGECQAYDPDNLRRAF